jgi:hypothetical protein
MLRIVVAQWLRGVVARVMAGFLGGSGVGEVRILPFPYPFTAVSHAGPCFTWLSGSGWAPTRVTDPFLHQQQHALMRQVLFNMQAHVLLPYANTS